MKKKACRNCKIFAEGDRCPICDGTDFSTNWQGRVTIMDKEHSTIAQKMGTSKNGEYVIKLR